MKRKLVAISLLVALDGSALAQDFTAEQQQMMGNAYGQILGYVATMDHMKQQCGAGIEDLTAIWKTRNAATIAQSDALMKRFINWAAKKSATPPDQVEALLREQIIKPMTDSVDNSFAKFDSAPPDAKAAVCKNFANDVNAGKWDVSTKDPSLYKYLATQSN